MKHLSILSVLACVLLQHSAWGTDGYSVTTVVRWTGAGDIPENGLGMMHGGMDGVDMPGTIVRGTIENDRLTAIDTIYKQTFAKFPVINLPGTKVAFYRWEARVENGALVDADKPRHISVMDIDGSNVRDLATFTDRTDQRVYLDWTAGDWIYYVGPLRQHAFDDCMVWRVKPDDPSTNEFVCSYAENNPTFTGYFRWDITADGTRSTLNGVWDWGYTNICTDFPLSQPAMVTGHDGTYTGPCCCNIACSPSGLFLGSFIDGGHRNVWWRRWDPDDVTGVSQETATSAESMSAWAGEDAGNDMGMLRWSTNSDKWYCVMASSDGCHDGTCGSNQVLVNHIDRKAIKVTDFPTVSRTTQWASTTPVIFGTAGDFWVKAPVGAGDSYEDTLGNWVPVDGGTAERGVGTRDNRSAGQPMASFRRRAEGIVVTFADAHDRYLVELLSAGGERVYMARTSSSSLTIERHLLPPGTVVVRIAREQGGRSWNSLLAIQ